MTMRADSSKRLTIFTEAEKGVTTRFVQNRTLSKKAF
jgi:hypothetical protein